MIYYTSHMLTYVNQLKQGYHNHCTITKTPAPMAATPDQAHCTHATPLLLSPPFDPVFQM